MGIVVGDSSPSSLPAWAPAGQDVADYIPWRTLTRAESSVVESDDTYQQVFSDSTRPTGVQVDRLIGNACARVLARVGTLADSLQDSARVVTCLQVGSWIERSWPEDQDSQIRADALAKEAETMLGELAAANEAATGEDPFAIDVAPAWSFPPADPRYDYANYF